VLGNLGEKAEAQEESREPAVEEAIMTPKEHNFTKAMYNICRQAYKKYGYNATRFLQMLMDDKNGVITAKRLLAEEEQQSGFVSLVSLGAPELTVEAHILMDEYIELFMDDKEICERAANRLKQYDPDFFTKHAGLYSRYLGCGTSKK